MAINNLSRPSLINSYRHEFFKGSKLKYYRYVLLLPPLLTAVIMLIQTLVKVFGNPKLSPSSLTNLNDVYGLGLEGSVAFASGTLTPLYGVFSLLLIIGCALMVSNEYRWNTMKVLATRQPDRMRLVLSKWFFCFTFILCATVSFMLCWLLYIPFTRYFFDQPFTITASDWADFGGGLKYFALQGLLAFIYSSLAIALTFQFKSVVAGIIVYFVYNSIDASLSSLSTVAINENFNPDGIFGILAAILKFINPFLLNSNFNRIIMQETTFLGSTTGMPIPNEQIVISNPVWWAWIMLAIYLFIFTALAVYFFSRRDITE
ncbi:MAG: ABC transporter permease [Chloroflexi bacterium]|uniref:ABC transporter permease n=1 Tax=Candidatus Chlorohelix allophototropha TaxID=3003348 RepID=A0A8T7M777_9CHLR|nr:ABC transporter permease [Chloroflexota bacterium]WJW69905.1 ABC transporter permease [Chloroflexota bacterium L227-S17]